MAAQAASISLSHHETLERLSVAAAGADGNQKIGVAGPVDMRFDALGRSFELQLTPNSRLLDAARNIADKTITPYLGKLAGIEDSWVRMVIADGQPSGLIWDGSELFAIERAGENVAGSSAAIIYRLADAVIAPGSMTCGAGDSFANAGAVYKTLTSELRAATAQAEGATTQIDVGAVGDAEFAGIHGANSQQAILDRLSNVDGIFSSEVGVQINVPLVQVFTNSAAGSYPFDQGAGSTIAAGDLLDELRVYRNNEPNQNTHGLTHLWTGKDIEGIGGNNSTVGIAYSGGIGQGGGLVLCNREFGAALSEGRGSPTFDSLIAAHEIGHNFGAPHDGTTNSACESVIGNFIMAASLGNNTVSQFSQCSLDEMADDIALAESQDCITPLPSVDMTFGPDGPASDVLLGNSATITFDVVNAGTLPASNVVADFTLPPNVSLIAAAPSLGTCSSGGGMVNCAIGEVQGTTTVSVTLTSDTIAVGSGTFDASVSAVDDDDLTNNQSSLTLTVDPAVNLSVTPPSTRQLAIDQSTGLTALIENTSILDATGVTLDIASSPGLRVDSASWPLGACAVTSTQVNCDGATFGALSNATLSLGVTATSAGSKTISFTMAAAEAEADPSNNTANATINVGSPAQDDSGGGSTGLWLLSLLGLFAARRRVLSPE
jgi:MYXO-CTERM domain-containing protein